MTSTPATKMPDASNVGGVNFSNQYAPPDRLEAEWDDAIEEYEAFMSAAPGLKLSRKLHTMKKVTKAWLPFLDAEGLKLGLGAENFINMLLALENKIKQYVSALGNDPATKDDPIPECVDQFLQATSTFRDLRRPARAALNYTVATAKTPPPESSKKPSSAKKDSKSAKRPRSASLDPSDVETVDPDELDQEDVNMADATQSQIATLPDPPTDTDSEVEAKAKPAKKKVKVTQTPKAEPSSSKKSVTAVPKEGDDSLSYQEVLKILDEANKLVGNAAKIPHTVDGLQRMDCAIRTHLSQIAIRISIEIAKYDSVFEEYNRIRAIMETRSIGPKDHTLFE